MDERENDEVLTEMKDVTPEDLPREGESEPFVPSPKWKRALAWALFAIVFIGLIFWLLNIAYPSWAAEAGQWLRGLLS